MKVIKPLDIDNSTTIGADEPAPDGSGGTCITDPYYTSNVVLLLHGEDLTDSSPNVKTISSAGSASASSAYKKFGTKSIAVVNTGDYLYTPSSTDFNLTGDFTIECWVYRTVTKGSYAQGILVRRVYNNTGSGTWRLTEDAFQNLQNPALVIGFAIPYNTWTHVAITRDTGVIRAFINGILASSMTDTTNFSNSQQMFIGRDWDGASNTVFGGYLDEVRITKGVSRYPKVIEVPTVAKTSITDSSWSNVILSLNFENNVSDSSNSGRTVTEIGDVTFSSSSKFGSYCGEFDGSNDYLTISTPADFAIDADYTIEAWIKPTAVAGSHRYIFSLCETLTGAFAYFYVAVMANGALATYCQPTTGGGGPYVTSVSGLVTADGLWHHVAFSRSGVNAFLFYDGAHVASTGAWPAYPAAKCNYAGVGGIANGYYSPPDAGRFAGFIDGLVVTKGTARYKTFFTPPVYPGCEFGAYKTPGTKIEYTDLTNFTVGIDPDIWVSGRAYTTGSKVSLLTTNKIYQAITNVLLGDITSPDVSIQLAIPKWIEIGSTNKFAMFDLYRNTPSIFTIDTMIVGSVPGSGTVNHSSISIDIVSEEPVTLALLNLVNIGKVVVVCTDNSTSTIISTVSYEINTRNVYDWWTYFTTQFTPRKSFVLNELPSGYPDMKITVYFIGSPDMEVGSFIVGPSTFIGILQQGSELDAINFSTMDRDVFGNAILVPRRSITSIKGELFIPKEIYEDVISTKLELDATPALWIGSENVDDTYYQSLLLFGIYREFNFKLDNPIGSFSSIELEEI